ncbi:MAG TPA: LLM class flavin-dependent oxidoreductase [Thermomonospora sp.]|nr:LLM class flavin-dependent oxidoreductase [Thermomonospora sp.]
MPDYGHDLRFAANLLPSSEDPAGVVRLVRAAEDRGADLVTFQDHPYQPGYLDTWTLLAYAAAATTRIRLAGNVHPLPLRPPAMLAQSAASLDLLSGGRFELGLGTGAFWDAIEAMGGPRRAPGDAVDALEEGIRIIRELWDADARGGVRFEGRHYQVHGAKRGPRPAHDIGIWLGAYGPRMLRLTGRVADGWLPSLPYLKSVERLAEGNAVIDEAAVAAGRSPESVVRLLNLVDEPHPEEIADLALTHGVSVFTLIVHDDAQTGRWLEETVPAARELIVKERG